MSEANNHVVYKWDFFFVFRGQSGRKRLEIEFRIFVHKNECIFCVLLWDNIVNFYGPMQVILV